MRYARFRSFHLAADNGARNPAILLASECGTPIATYWFAHYERVAPGESLMTQRSESKVVGCYANFLVVGHNAFEFVFDFGQLYEGSEAAQMHTRIVTAPVYAKAMLATLRSSIERFETTHGAIPEAEGEAAGRASTATHVSKE